MKKKREVVKYTLLAVAIVSSVHILTPSERLLASPAQATLTGVASTPATKVATPSVAARTSTVAQSPARGQKTSPIAAPTRYKPNPLARRAELHYDLIWGVDSLKVKYAESGEMIRFSYRVLNAEKAKPLNDKKNEPSLLDPKSGVKLVVPSMEKIGKLRQSSTPEAGKMYWMAFSNKGRRVKPGDHVNVVIGKFEANGLLVE